MSKLTATPAQRKNIRLLLSYLSAILPTDMANEYNHESFASCTVGYAIRSGLFPELVKNTKPVRVLDFDLADGSEYDDIDSLFEAVFGVDYTHGIIYSADLDDVYDVDAGRKQLEYVIKSIRKLFNLKAEPLHIVKVVEKVDTTKQKIEQRIAQLTNYINVASELPDEYNRHTKASVDAARVEINALSIVLAI